MDFETLRFEVVEGVARITLARPADANAIDLVLAQELLAAAARCDGDRGVRAVLVSGEGRFFCSGGDLGAFRRAGPEGMSPLIKEITTHLHAAISTLARMRAPVVVAVNGTAAGAGMSLACAGDLALAARSARFTLAYTRVGLAPDGSSTFFLPRLVGVRRTLDLLLTNRTLSAEEALAWGLVNRVVEDDALAREAFDMARCLAAGPTQAFAHAKRLVLDSLGESLETQMELEARAIADAARTADAREGMAAFFEKREPRFHGR